MEVTTIVPGVILIGSAAYLMYTAIITERKIKAMTEMVNDELTETIKKLNMETDKHRYMRQMVITVFRNEIDAHRRITAKKNLATIFKCSLAEIENLMNAWGYKQKQPFKKN